MKDLNKLIGIPFKLGGDTFSGCDCKGICYLYHKYVHDRELRHNDGKRLIFRNKSKDAERINDFMLNNFAKKIDYNELNEGDFILLKSKNIGMLGVCINNKKVLYMTEKFGSCLIQLFKIKNFFVCGYRLI